MAVSTQAATPTIAEMVERAKTLLPRLRERADQAERLRHVPDETIQEFLDAGLFRVLQPKRWGGYELDYGRTQVELCNVLGQACGSSAWVQSVVACHAWCLAMFESEAQDAVWSRDSDTLVASAFAFASGRGRPVEDQDACQQDDRSAAAHHHLPASLADSDGEEVGALSPTGS